MHALIIGATGATGRDLLEQLLADPQVNRVDIFVRRETGIKQEKLQTHVVDFNNVAQWKDLVKGDVLFSCLGTTLKVAGSKEAQWKIDYEYQYQFAEAAKANNVPQLVLISADMASTNSRLFYSRMKGKLEEAVKALNFFRLDIFNPPLLVRKNTDRGGERIAKTILGIFNKLGLFRSQRPLLTEDLAKAMIRVAKNKSPGVFKYRNMQIRELLREH
ncbi:MAG: NAD(P)H-binding protein [Chitinophagaceae bacterium]|nr:NAD(P)H-binding protein [Chitinophagaceae bacterium]